MKPFRLLACLAAWAITGTALATPHDFPAHDSSNSHDHPLVSRFAGSVIIGYQQVDYDRMLLPLGKVVDDKLTQSASVEGRITRIAYVAPLNKSALEIFRNFQAALASAGFTTRFSCEGDATCGDGYHFADAVFDPVREQLAYDEPTLAIDTMEPANDNINELTAHLSRPRGDVDLVLLVAKDDNQLPGIFLEICEHKPMASGEVTVDAKAMGEDLASAGHVALYGLHFANDSATIDPSSKATLDEMAKLLTGHPALKVYIVGHTDDTGSAAHNLALSQQRAQAVVQALATGYHIAANRMAAEGVASWAPVASNATDAGRAQNRRVELVAQ
ncbi:OmpA family protein [Dyella ginsengisoli]|uniref:OmpA family protein n=1 Tax=Dyella ginsengisoli TaxID=363848 RepID=UPI00034D8CF7|nr:OmpA family protein [Dyella ginsengisoli]